MVLRGSDTKPDKSIARQVELKAKAEDLEMEAHYRAEGVRQSLDLLETGKLNPEEQQFLIKQLHKRVTELEAKETAAHQAAAESSENIRRVAKQLTAGGLAGAVARTCVAPLDRVKILMQTQFLSQQQAIKDSGGKMKYNGIVQTLTKVFKEEGVGKLWRGNGTNMFRIIPYAATQFTAYDFFKRSFLQRRGQDVSDQGNLHTYERLLSGALAGTTATTVTYPLDIVRLRLAVQPELKGAYDAFKSVIAENGARTLLKGYFPTVLSLSPFIAINFTAFDTLKKKVYPNKGEPQSHLMVLGCGAVAGLFAQTCCYPLDTVRRRMQLKGNNYSSTPNAFATILRKEGLAGFYKGIGPNALKVIPNNGIRFLAYEFLKKKIGVEDRRR